MCCKNKFIYADYIRIGDAITATETECGVLGGGYYAPLSRCVVNRFGTAKIWTEAQNDCRLLSSNPTMTGRLITPVNDHYWTFLVGYVFTGASSSHIWLGIR